MLTFVLRRALVQRRMLVAAVVLITAATTLLGIASLLLGETQDRAFSEEIESSQPQDVDVTAFLVGLAAPDLEATRQQAADLVSDVLAPMEPTVTSTVTTRMRLLHGTDGFGYLASSDAFDGRADLTSGRWPAVAASGPPEAVAPAAAASPAGAEPRRPGDPGPGDRPGCGPSAGDRRGRRHLPAARPRRLGHRPALRSRLRPGLQRRLEHRGGVRPVRDQRRGPPSQRLLGRRGAGDRAPRSPPRGRRVAARRGGVARRRLPAAVGARRRPRGHHPGGLRPARDQRAGARPAGHDPVHRPGGAAPGDDPLAGRPAARGSPGRRRPRRRAGPPRRAGARPRPAARDRAGRGGAARRRLRRAGGPGRRARPLAPDPAAGDARGRLDPGPDGHPDPGADRGRRRRGAHAGPGRTRPGHPRHGHAEPTPGGGPLRCRRAAGRPRGGGLVAAAHAAGHGRDQRRRRPHAGPGAVAGRGDRGRRARRAAAARPPGRCGHPLARAGAPARRQPGSAPTPHRHGDGPARDRGRGRDLRHRAAGDLGALAGRPGGPARGHRPGLRAAGPGDPRRRRGRGRGDHRRLRRVRGDAAKPGAGPLRRRHGLPSCARGPGLGASGPAAARPARRRRRGAGSALPWRPPPRSGACSCPGVRGWRWRARPQRGSRSR